MCKLAPGKEISFFAPDEDPVFAGEKEDIKEIVGNLMENAAK